ncbi:MAG: rod shape-determining protein RodA [Alphaproteobacteria bacterium]|nr:rod shape-determining protein RodA [Alphaproteobacteria bacterium]
MKISKKKFYFVNTAKILFCLLVLILAISILGQISAFNGNYVVIQKHVARLFFGLVIMVIVASVHIKTWENFAYVFYLCAFISLMIVELLGVIKLGAQRWIDLYIFTFQPSEFMKIALILALSRYYSSLTIEELKNLKNHRFPLMLIMLPAILITKQPDLGTALLLISVGIGMMFLAGFPFKPFCYSVLGIIGLCPFGWYALHDYQKNRILNFLDSDRDPLGTGYHVLQSKIAIGSGHLFGKGLFQGTQSNLNFLPEKHTDFIFTTIAEEWGFVGAVFIIFLFVCLVMYFFQMGRESKNKFSRHLSNGIALLLFLHVFVNISMVMGILPVVGIPLPFLSYGGSSMITFMIGIGLIVSALSRIYRRY